MSLNINHTIIKTVKKYRQKCQLSPIPNYILLDRGNRMQENMQWRSGRVLAELASTWTTRSRRNRVLTRARRYCVHVRYTGTL